MNALVKLKIVESPDDLSKIIQILTFIKQSIKRKKKTESRILGIKRFIIGNGAKMLLPNPHLRSRGRNPQAAGYNLGGKQESSVVP